MVHATFSYAKKGVLVRLTYLVAALCYCVLCRIRGRGHRGVVILCYHAVRKAQRRSFERQMAYVAGRVRSLDQVDREGIRSAVVVTFDDAFECLLENALPVTARLGIPISVFAVTDNCGRTPGWMIDPGHPDALERTMNEEQLRYLSGQPGCLVGSHTCSHRPLGDLAPGEVEKELRDSRSFLAALLGTPIDYLALPHGSCAHSVILLAQRLGYRKVLTLDEITEWDDQVHAPIGRFSVSPDMWMLEFVLTVQGAYAWLHPWRNWLRRVRAFIRRGARQ